MGQNYSNPKYIIDFFCGLNATGIPYVLIKNIGGELPNALVNGKDIDILVKKEAMPLFHNYITKIGTKVMHPKGRMNGWVNLNGLEPFEFWRLNTADDIYIDVSNKLCCHSMRPMTWMPVSDIIQNDLWNNKVYDEDNKWWRIDDNVLFFYMIIRSVFDKQCFNDVYKKEIVKYSGSINHELVLSYLKLVFFNFSDQLLKMIYDREFDSILVSYKRFCDY